MIWLLCLWPHVSPFRKDAMCYRTNVSLWNMWKATDVSLICWVNLRPFLVTWSVLVYIARKQVRHAFLWVARLTRYKVKAIYTALAFTGLIQSSLMWWTNSQVHVIRSLGWNHSLHSAWWFMSITEHRSFYFYSSFMINTKHIIFSYCSLKLSFFLKNESTYSYLVWRMYSLTYELRGSGGLSGTLGRDWKQMANEVRGGVCVFNSVSHSHDRYSRVNRISCSNDVA